MYITLGYENLTREHIMKHITVILLAAVVYGCGPKLSTPRLNARPSSAEHETELSYKPGEAIVDIHSERGIGSATVTKAEDRWPAKVVFHLHLRGLESFSVSNRRIEVQTSVQSTGSFRVLCRTTGKQGTNITNSDPFWMNAEIVPARGKKPAIPLESGYFRVTVPTALLAENPVALNVHWIDFYR